MTETAIERMSGPLCRDAGRSRTAAPRPMFERQDSAQGAPRSATAQNRGRRPAPAKGTIRILIANATTANGKAVSPRAAMLSERDLVIVRHVAAELTNKAIAARVHLSPHTIKIVSKRSRRASAFARAPKSSPRRFEPVWSEARRPRGPRAWRAPPSLALRDRRWSRRRCYRNRRRCWHRCACRRRRPGRRTAGRSSRRPPSPRSRRRRSPARPALCACRTMWA
jgi:hypothetical protein